MIQAETTKDTKGSADRLSYDIVGAAIEVHRRLGPGLLESAYEACLAREFLFRSIQFERQVPLGLEYRGMGIDCGYRLDLVVAGLVIVEVKAVAKILPIHRAQMMTYVKLRKLSLGIIINFNVEILRMGIYRVVIG